MTTRATKGTGRYETTLRIGEIVEDYSKLDTCEHCGSLISGSMERHLYGYGNPRIDKIMVPCLSGTTR